MKREDVQALRTPLIALAVTIIVSVCAIVYSRALANDARALLTRAEVQLRNERSRIHGAAENKAMVARYSGAYQQLAHAGFAGEEQRMNWIDGLRTANQEARTFGVEYDIGAQRPYAHAAEVNPGPLKLSESLMQIRLRLLHEEDLLRFLEALTRTGSGFFTVDRCILRRLTEREGESTARMQENLLAECELRWLTVQAPTTSAKK